MENAWLDSLSEDWISQPQSAGSPAGSLPSLAHSTASLASSIGRVISSRIPVYSSRKQNAAQDHDSSNLPLSERSINDINIPLSQRGLKGPSKLRNELPHRSRGRRLSRSVSTSTTSSVQHHTVQHKSLSTSPKKSRQTDETPEWKRRLLHGDVAYGEQCDLFGPIGLESIFQPPPPQMQPYSKSSDRSLREESLAMPSSPPPYVQTRTGPSVVGSAAKEIQRSGRREPRAMKYRLAETEADDFSDSNLTRNNNFHRQTSPSQDVTLDYTSDLAASKHSVTSSLSHIQVADTKRTVSGYSDIRHEDLSPIFISRHNTIDGNVDYAPLDLSTSELHQRLQEMSIDNELRPSHAQQDSSILQQENAINNTDDFAHNGKFVNLERGGQSNEGSFQRRMLSSTSVHPVDESEMLQEESVQASTPKQLPQIRKNVVPTVHDQSASRSASSQLPNTPHHGPAKSAGPTAKAASGSPLKLFDTYDTFTNQTLLRRLSQFEDSLPGEDTQESLKITKARDSTGLSVNYADMNVAYIAPSSPSKTSEQKRSDDRSDFLEALNTFGNGNLDQFEFSEEASLSSSQESFPQDRDNVSVQQPGPVTRKSFSFHLQPSPALGQETLKEKSMIHTTIITKESLTNTRKATHRGSANFIARSNRIPSQEILATIETPRKHYGDNESKRLFHSPSKNPTPKRRRTLHKTDSSDNEQVLDSVRESHQQMQSIISKKRKDARHEDNQQPADPEVMATRQILRPRNPTPNQRNTREQERFTVAQTSLEGAQKTRFEMEQKIARVQAELDATAAGLGASLGVGHPMHDDSRKGSVTTQDFLDEAKKIMAGIRGKARRSGLNSVEESESENDKPAPSLSEPEEDVLDDSYQESTKEPFSRPPSREGAPVPRLPQKQQDPEVLSHLRKYEEMSDLDGMIASSMKSISLAREVVGVAQELDRLADETVNKSGGQKLNLEQPYQSDPPNIQITEYPDLQRKRKHSTSSIPTAFDENHEPEFPSNGSNSSSGQSTGRSIPTGSSRGSESRRVIAAHTVAHLIPEQLAGMVFDREKSSWVKRKVDSVDKQNRGIIPSDDDDPFGDIPDLTVDETQELQRVKAVAARQREEARISEVQEYNRRHYKNGGLSRDGQPAVTHSTFDQSGTASGPSSKQSNLTHFASGTRTQDTPLTSSRDEQSSVTKLAHSVHYTKTSATSEVEDKVEEYEEEISIHQSRVDSHTATPQRRVTISFSSPLASIIEPEDHDGIEAEMEDSIHRDTLQVLEQGRRRTSYATRNLSSQRTTARRMSLGGNAFIARPVSRIDEREEGSFSEHLRASGQRSVSIVMSTPDPPRSFSEQSAMTAPASIGVLQLSPLSDFTINQPDESFAFEISYIGRKQHRQDHNSKKQLLSISIKDLVREITDIEPYEPFWDHIKQANLRSKRLQSLHMLSKFCGQLEELDVSDNQIGQLNGAPETIRHLRITHNLLSDISSWNHLKNLQYVDVSNNELTTLDSFKDLIHLRALRADNNKISSLNGVTQLDGLMSLRLRNNLMKSIDFTATSLQRLTDLDLKGNSIRDVRNLQELHSLTTLNLEDNELSNFTLENCEIVLGLKYLKLGGNLLEALDVSLFPNLRLLYLDRNRLIRVTGLLKAKHLDSLSLREQKEGSVIDSSFLDEAFEVRKLFLSGNYLAHFAPRVDFLNLQFLELANCGLESLPVEFGQMMSNVRVLNLNFNALRDIKPLLGIVRLKRLHLAGNRLFRLRKTTNVLAQLSTLSKIDLRNNPMTVGFYPPVTEKRVIVQHALDDENESAVADPFTLEDGEKDKDAAYAGRLDMETRMRRRIFEMLTLGGCTRLRMLDGLKVDIPNLETRDRVWEELNKAGLVDGMSSSRRAAAIVDGEPLAEAVVEERTNDVPKKEDLIHVNDISQETANAGEAAENVTSKEWWGAEDSFA